jgi:hypothetical protein
MTASWKAADDEALIATGLPVAFAPGAVPFTGSWAGVQPLTRLPHLQPRRKRSAGSDGLVVALGCVVPLSLRPRVLAGFLLAAVVLLAVLQSLLGSFCALPRGRSSYIDLRELFADSGMLRAAGQEAASASGWTWHRRGEDPQARPFLIPK